MSLRVDRSLRTITGDLGRSLRWRFKQNNDVSIWTAGDIQIWPELLKLEVASISCLLPKIRLLLKRQFACFGLVIQMTEGVIAVVDQVRSQPIFFSESEDALVIGANVTDLLALRSSYEIEQESIEEYLLCGYVLGTNTLVKGIKQLRPGEFISLSYDEFVVRHERYFRYLPVSQNRIETTKSISDWSAEFGQVLNRVFERTLRLTEDRPIWIPLSGGFDSRLVLCKCLEFGYRNIATFSYGVRNNHEIRMARKIARQLNVPWYSVPSKLKQLRHLYTSKTREDYSRFSGDFHAVPSYLDFEAVYKLRKDLKIPDNAIVINGYSGDFLFGGHIPESLNQQPDFENLVEALIEKHCSLFSTSPLNMVQLRLRKKIASELDAEVVDKGGREELCAGYEYWDWQERQAKAVVNAQKVYEFFGLDWLLPLWDRELMDFWATVPLDLRLGQRLHGSYLREYNFNGAFNFPRSRNELWTPSLSFIPLIGKLIEWTANSKSKEEFYERSFYFGYFRNQLGLFGYREYMKYWPKTRRPRVVPIAAIHLLKEMDMDPSPYLD